MQFESYWQIKSHLSPCSQTAGSLRAGVNEQLVTHTQQVEDTTDRGYIAVNRGATYQAIDLRENNFKSRTFEGDFGMCKLMWLVYRRAFGSFVR